MPGVAMVTRKINLLGMVWTGADRRGGAPGGAFFFFFAFSSPFFARQAQAQSSRRIPERSPTITATLQGLIRDQSGRAIPGVQLDLHSTITGQHYSAATDAEGIFRLRDIRLGVYEVKLVREGFLTKIIPSFEVNKPELTVLELELHALDEAVPAAMCPSGVPGIPGTAVPASPATPYPGVQRSSSQGASAA